MRDYIFKSEVLIMNKKVKITLGILGGVVASSCLIALGYNIHMKKKQKVKEDKHSYSCEIHLIR